MHVKHKHLCKQLKSNYKVKTSCSYTILHDVEINKNFYKFQLTKTKSVDIVRNPIAKTSRSFHSTSLKRVFSKKTNFENRIIIFTNGVCLRT